MPNSQTDFGITISSFTDTDGWRNLPFGLSQTQIRLGGEPSDPVLMMTHFPPNAFLPRHDHPSPFCDAVVEGSMWVEDDQTWYPRGAVRFVPSGVVYGPTRSGPDGLTLLEFYARFDGFGANLDWESMTSEQADEVKSFAQRRNQA